MREILPYFIQSDLYLVIANRTILPSEVTNPPF